MIKRKMKNVSVDFKRQYKPPTSHTWYIACVQNITVQVFLWVSANLGIYSKQENLRLNKTIF